jgi:hypothetical protein
MAENNEALEREAFMAEIWRTVTTRRQALVMAALTLCWGWAGIPAATATTEALSPAALGSPCDRACLTDMVAQYFTALTAHDASKLPLRHEVRYTENGQTLRLDDGLWATADAVADYRIDVADPKAGEVGFIGTIRESGRLALLALRLKVEGRKISEIEAVIARKSGPTDGFAKFEDLKDKPIFHTLLKPAERRPRAEMIAITNSYFEGLEQATGKGTPFDAHCSRFENGMNTANNASSPALMSKRTCGEQFDTGFSTFISEVRGRRFPVVDEENGLVLAFLSFDHSGRIKSVPLTDGTTLHVPPPFDTPYSFLIAELFKIKDGKITQIEAVLLTTPYAMPSGW